LAFIPLYFVSMRIHIIPSTSKFSFSILLQCLHFIVIENAIYAKQTLFGIFHPC